MALKTKQIGNAPLKEQPVKPLKFKIGDNVIGTNHLKDSSVTFQKLSPDVQTEIDTVSKIYVTVFCGEWVNGALEDPPTIGQGIYLYKEYNPNTHRRELHQVSYKDGLWQPNQHIPVHKRGIDWYYPPKWNSPYWTLVNGSTRLAIEFVSSMGYSFRRGNVDTVIGAHLFYGNVEITEDVPAAYWNWTRSSETGKTPSDETWDAQHQGMKTLHLTNADMPASWSFHDKAIFTLTVTVNDGKEELIVQNQIIS